MSLPNEPRFTDRRTVLKTIGGGLVMGSAAAPASAADDELAAQLNAVRAATRKYRDIETARADGYETISPYVPGMGFHFADGPPFGTDLEDPGVLVYYATCDYDPEPGAKHDPDRDDDLVLGATEWLVPDNQEKNPPSIFDDGASDRELQVSEEAGWHYEDEQEFTGLHAWVHRENPAGVFHPTNPELE